MLVDENVFYTKKRVMKYLLKEYKDSEYMIVLFSGLSSHPEKKSVYNYIKCLDNVPITRLHILDEYGYDNRGCWYLGESKELDVEESTIEVINYFSNKYKIKKDKIILAGTSKGGFAGLYLGIKYGYGNIIVGAPQIILGEYLDTPFHRGRLKFISGYKNEEEKEKEKEKLDKIIKELKIQSNTKIDILCGINDDRHIKQIEEFYLESSNKEAININLCSGDHGNIGNKYKEYLPKRVKSIISGQEQTYEHLEEDIFKEKYSVEDALNKINLGTVNIYVNDENKLNIDFNPININLKYACYLICAETKEILYKTQYQTDTHFEFEAKQKDYIAKIYIKNENNDKVSRSIRFTLKSRLTVYNIR